MTVGFTKESEDKISLMIERGSFQDRDDLEEIVSILLTDPAFKISDGSFSFGSELSSTIVDRQPLREFGLYFEHQTDEFVKDLANFLGQGLRDINFGLDSIFRSKYPKLLVEGDSWTFHPLIDDIVDHLGNRYNIKSLAAAGDVVSRMLKDPSTLSRHLKEVGSRILLFSGGGNDILGDRGIDALLKTFKTGVPTDAHINQSVLDREQEQVLGGYRNMLKHLQDTCPEVMVFGHGYDNLVKLKKGKWLWPYFSQKGYDEETAQAVIAEILKQFNQSLSDLSDEFVNFTYVDMRGLVGGQKKDWFDAIHPNSEGFGRVANRFHRYFREHLKKSGLWPGNEVALSEPGKRAIQIGKPIEISNVNGDPGFRVKKTRVSTPQAKSFEEGLVQDVSMSGLTDVEAVRRLLNSVDSERSGWLNYDPKTLSHIEDVIKLFQEAGEKEKQKNIQGRLKTWPRGFMTPGSNLDEGYFFDNPKLQNEAIFGVNDLEPVDTLRLGYAAARAVCRVQVMSEYGTTAGNGTGFLVAPNLLLTNQHVLEDKDVASRSIAVFDDERPLDGTLPNPKAFKITGDFFLASEDLDYAFASVEPMNQLGQSLSEFGNLNLIRDTSKAIKWEQVSVIQHPGGGPKSIAIRNSSVIGRVGSGVYYTSDTLRGSSGSCVINRQWQVVALHHKRVPHPTDVETNIANRGVRISSIFKDLEAKAQAGVRAASSLLDRLAGKRDWAPVRNEFVAFNQANPFVIDAKQSHQQASPVGALQEGSYAGLTEQEFLTAVGKSSDWEDGSVPYGATMLDVDELLPSGREAVLKRIGKVGYQFILAHEVSSKATYEARLKNPVLPGAYSGITIGIGYDLRYVSRSEFTRDWKPNLTDREFSALSKCVGKRGNSARGQINSVKFVEVPYDTAIFVFESTTLGKYFSLLNAHFPDDVLDALTQEQVSALLSLTFNRGASFQKSGSRFSEMRAIRTAILREDFQAVPDLFRSMKRLWVGMPHVRGLLRRREEEAELFERGTMASRTSRELVMR